MNRAHGVLHARIRHLEAVGAETGERHRHGHLRLRARHELRGGNRGDFRQLRLRVLDDHLRVDREAEGERLRTQQVEGVLLAALQVLHRPVDCLAHRHLHRSHRLRVQVHDRRQTRTWESGRRN